jgi:hypothetical protein
MLGTWTTLTPNLVPNSCSSLQWQITSQTAISISGTFSAVCEGGISGTGTATGTMIDAYTARVEASGTATVPNVASCPFQLSGTAYIEDDAIRIPFTGTTCLGPVQGEVTLRRPSTPPPPPAPNPQPPPPPPPPPPPTPDSSYHVPPGPLTVERAEQVVRATAREFPNLTAPKPTEAQSLRECEELMLRMIWHLQLAGYPSGRQRNPSGAISLDKLTILINGAWHAYDVLSLGNVNEEIPIHFIEVFPANHVPDGGIPD